MRPKLSTLLAGALVALAALALPARAADELEPHAFPDLKCTISVPKSWVEWHDKRGVKWEVENSSSRCELMVFEPRKDLADVERNLRAKTAEKKWKLVDEPVISLVNGCKTLQMTVDLPSNYPLRQLFTVIDEADATYMITYGDLKADFDRKLIDQIVASFKRSGAHEGGSGPTATATPDAGVKPAAGEPVSPDWGCAACKKAWPRSLKFCGDCGAKNATLEPEKKHYGCASCKKDWPESMKFCGECGAKNGPFAP